MQISSEVMDGQRIERRSGCVSYAVPQQDFTHHEFAEVVRACELAEAGFDRFRYAPLPTRADLLDMIAGALVESGDELIAHAHLETSLPETTLEAELTRTVGQLTHVASLVRDGTWLDLTAKPMRQKRTPSSRPTFRMRRVPVGPVALFGTSKPLGVFSVAGVDTASALASGCPVVVKPSSAHIGTSELIGLAIRKSLVRCGLPSGTFSLLVSDGLEVGEALVAHPAIKAVSFTGQCFDDFEFGGTASIETAAIERFLRPAATETSQ